jgi:hypothetical protein
MPKKDPVAQNGTLLQKNPLRLPKKEEPKSMANTTWDRRKKIHMPKAWIALVSKIPLMTSNARRKPRNRPNIGPINGKAAAKRTLVPHAMAVQARAAKMALKGEGRITRVRWAPIHMKIPEINTPTPTARTALFPIVENLSQIKGFLPRFAC